MKLDRNCLLGRAIYMNSYCKTNIDGRMIIEISVSVEQLGFYM